MIQSCFATHSGLVICRNVKLIRGCDTCVALGMECVQNCWVLPFMISTSPEARLHSHFCEWSSLLRNKKRLVAPNDRDPAVIQYIKCPSPALCAAKKKLDCRTFCTHTAESRNAHQVSPYEDGSTRQKVQMSDTHQLQDCPRTTFHCLNAMTCGPCHRGTG